MESFLQERKSKEKIKLNVDADELSKILQNGEKGQTSGTAGHHKNNSWEAKQISAFLFDRTKFIIKLLRICKEKLSGANETLLAKGLEWLSNEIQDSILFKTDEQSIKKLEEMKKENKELQTIFSWLEEYSSITIKQKDGFNKIKNTQSESESVGYAGRWYPTFPLANTENEEDACEELNLYTNREDIQFLNISEDSITTIEDPSFDIYKLESEVGQENILQTISCYIFTTLGFYSIVKYDKFEMFIQEIAKGYSRDNSYHTDLHAADVLQTCSTFLKWGKIQEVLKLTDLDVCALLISTIIHDYKHPGKTNAFLINSGHPIAIKYNDVSVLENFHIAEAFQLIKSEEEYNIFSDLSKEDYKTMRKRIIESVLATDMTFHAKQFTYLKLKIESLSITKGENVDKIFEGLDKMAVYSTQQEFLNVIIHACDISNPTKPFHIYKQWADRVMEEFWKQGDKEKELHFPVSFLCDRVTVSLPAAQIGFMDGIVTPFMTALREIFPGLGFLIDNVNYNKGVFKKLKEDEEEMNKKN